jgi:hypothetical protein
MKIIVVTTTGGQVIGTGRPPSDSSEIHFSISAGPGQKVHHLEVPDHLAKLKADDLHEEIRKYLPKKTSNKKTAKRARQKRR